MGRMREVKYPLRQLSTLIIPYNAFLGQAFTHSKHKMQSVPFCRFLELSVTSTSMGQTLLHLPQEMHLLLSQVTLVRAK